MSKHVPSDGSVTVDRFVSLADGDMHVMEDGQADAPALLLIHGSGGSTLWWDPVVAGLAEVFRVVRVDLLGHGSSASPTGGYDIPTHARRVGTALDELGVGRVTVVGHSMGCLVATALAEQRPHQTAALVLIDMGPSLDAAAPDRLLVRLLLARFSGPLLWRLRSEATIRRALRSAFARPVEVPYAIVGAALGMTHRALAGTARGAVDYINHQSLPDRLVALGVPLLVIFGQEDARYSSSSAADYRTVPGARIEVLAGVGHTPMLEDPQTTARLLRELTTTPVRPTVMETQRDVLGGALVDEVCDEGLAMTTPPSRSRIGGGRMLGVRGPAAERPDRDRDRRSRSPRQHRLLSTHHTARQAAYLGTRTGPSGPRR